MSASCKFISELISDPLKCQSMIGTKIVLKLVNKKEINGYLAAFDPVSGSIILKDADDEYQLVLPDSIIDVNVFNNDCIKIEPKRRESSNVTISSDEIEKRRSRIIKVIEDARLSVTKLTDGSIQVASVAVIKSPFTINDISTSNTLILDRIRELISD